MLGRVGDVALAAPPSRAQSVGLRDDESAKLRKKPRVAQNVNLPPRKRGPALTTPGTRRDAGPTPPELVPPSEVRHLSLPPSRRLAAFSSVELRPVSQRCSPQGPEVAALASPFLGGLACRRGASRCADMHPPGRWIYAPNFGRQVPIDPVLPRTTTSRTGFSVAGRAARPGRRRQEPGPDQVGPPGHDQVSTARPDAPVGKVRAPDRRGSERVRASRNPSGCGPGEQPSVIRRARSRTVQGVPSYEESRGSWRQSVTRRPGQPDRSTASPHPACGAPSTPHARPDAPPEPAGLAADVPRPRQEARAP